MVNQKIEKIKKLNLKFISLNKYKDRLIFFDEHFGILPFVFPFFHPKLDILFNRNEIFIINDLYQKEKVSNDLLKKQFLFDTAIFIFDVRPGTPNRQILNDYILEKFIKTDAAFTAHSQKLQDTHTNNKSLIEANLNDAIHLINIIEKATLNNKDRSLRNQFVSVFYEGYKDSNRNFIKNFPFKKKFVELYLYAQGILYDKYIKELIELNISTTKHSNTTIDKADNFKKLRDKILVTVQPDI